MTDKDNNKDTPAIFLSDHDKLIKLASELEHTRKVTQMVQEKTLDQMEKMILKDDELQKSIDALRLCQAQKLNTINETINQKFNEIKDIFQKHCVDEENQCRECAKHRDDQRAEELKEMKGLVKEIRDGTTSSSTFRYTVMFFVAVVGFIATLTIQNSNYISSHKEKTAYIEERVEQNTDTIIPLIPDDKRTYGLDEEN